LKFPAKKGGHASPTVACPPVRVAG
jgi:hypothetical protein